MTREVVRDEFSKIHGDQRGELRKIREVREDGKTDELTSAIRSNKFDVLNLTQRESCQERVADPDKGCHEDEGDEDGDAGGSKR